MSEKDNGGPAFPMPVEMGESGRYWTEHLPGMTLLDYFAAQAQLSCQYSAWEHKQAAEWCYARAAAMLEARKK